jgi:putative nucleotidyltransferase with HDIG domain
MIELLFVDDDPLILAGLKRLFRRFENEWQMDFVTSAEGALARMAQRRFDVIVTDMRMRGMDGGELLRQVREQYPSMIRVILSGQPSQEAAFRTLGPAHQYLTKPCDPTVLREAVQRATSLQKRMTDPQIQNVITRLAVLPCLPKVFHELVDELNSPKASIERVGQIVSRDVAITAKLMQLVNSSYFGLAHRVSSPAHAAAMLGLNLLRSVVLCVGVFDQFKLGHGSVSGFSLDQMVQHSLEVGQLAKQLAQSLTGDDQLADDALLGGFLHDVGKLALATCEPISYAAVLRLVQEKSVTSWQAERTLLKVSHAEIGGYLLSLWGLPQTVVEAVTLHHEPSSAGDKRFTALTAVHVANGMVHDRSPQWLERNSSRIDEQYLDSLGLQTTISEWLPSQVESAEAAGS